MSVTVILNGISHTIPTRNEQNWGSNVTAFLEDVVDVLNGGFQQVTASGATGIDFDNGRNVHLALNGSSTLTLSNPRTGRPSVFWIVQSNTSYTITWPASVKWQGGAAPSFSDSIGIYIVTLLYNSITSQYVGEFSSDPYS